MYETIITWAPITGNCILEVLGERFYHEEDGVGAMLTLSDSAIIHTPAPQVYCR